MLRKNQGSTLLRLLIGVAMLLALTALATSQQPEDNSQAVKFAFDPDFAPFSSTGRNNTPRGFTAEILNNLEQHSAYRFERIMAETSIVEALKSGDADLGAVPKLDSLPGNLYFSHPICNIQYGIFRLSSRWEISSTDALGDLETGFCKTDLDSADVRRLNNKVKSTSFESIEELLEALATEEIDAAIISEAPGLAKAHELGIAGRLTIIRAVGTKEYCIAGTRANRDVIRELDGQLESFLSTSKHAALVRKYLAPTGIQPWLNRNWQVVFLAAWPLLLVILGVWLWSSTLRRLVRERTAELNQSEQRYRQLVEDSPDGILVTDGLGVIINCSDAECDLLGYRHAELEGKHARRIMDEQTSSQFFEDLARIKDGNQVETFATLTRKGGSTVEVWRKGVPLFNPRGKFEGAVFYDRDLTERRQMEQELYSERDFTNAVIDTSGALVVVLDTRGSIVRMNPACEKSSGYKLSDLAGSTPWDSVVPPAHVEQSRMRFYQVLAGEWPMECEEIWQRASGEQRTIAWSYTVIVDENNSISYVVGTGIDVTEKRAVESSLAVEVRKHEQVVNATSEGFWLFDENFRSIDVNDALCRMLGYHREELLTLAPADLVHPSSRMELERQTKLIPTTDHRSYELELLRHDGSVLPVAVEASTMSGNTGGPPSSFMFLRDISQQKLNEAALQRSEVLHRKMFESNESVHLLLDADSTEIIDLNQAAVDYLGETAGSGTRLADYSSMDDEQFIRIIRRIALEPTGQLFFKLRGAGGELREVESHLSRIDTGERRLLYAIILDVTNRRRSEEKLRRSEERLNAIFNHAAIGITLISQESRYIQCNDTWCMMTGYNPDELNLLTPEDLTHPDDRERTAGYLKEVLAGSKNNYRVQNRFVRRNGSYFWADVSVTVIRNTMGSVEAVLGVATDITDTKQSEYERERLIEDLSRAALEIKTLKGLLPICASCKKIRDDSGYWQQIEGYVKERTEADFTHSMCPDCTTEMYPNIKLSGK